MAQPIRILVVEDSLLVAMSLECALADAGHEVMVAESNAAARLAMTQQAFDAALVDFHLADGDSSALCADLTRAGIRVALVTGVERDSIALPGIQRIFYKPISEQDLLAWLVKSD